VRNGEFSFLGDDGPALSGTLVSPVNAGRHHERARIPRGSMVG
jgi:hypothetical protein